MLDRLHFCGWAEKNDLDENLYSKEHMHKQVSHNKLSVPSVLGMCFSKK